MFMCFCFDETQTIIQIHSAHIRLSAHIRSAMARAGEACLSANDLPSHAANNTILHIVSKAHEAIKFGANIAIKYILSNTLK